jgi:hypothetical protein
MDPNPNPDPEPEPEPEPEQEQEPDPESESVRIWIEYESNMNRNRIRTRCYTEKFKDFIKQYFENKLGIEITGIVLHNMLCDIGTTSCCIPSTRIIVMN